MADTKQHDETLNTTLTDASEIYFEKEVATVWTPFRTTLLALKNYFLSFFPAKTIQLTYDEAVAIIDSTSDGQEYRIVGTVGTPLPSGVSYIITKGIFNGTNTFSKRVLAVRTVDGLTFNADYDLATNSFVGVLEQEFLIIDDGVVFTITAIKDDFVGKTYTVNYDVSNNTPYIVETALNTWDSAKTKIIGSSSTDENGELLISYGFYDNPKKLIIYPCNVFATATSEKQKQHGMTFRVITTL